jgi:hypothetical protein
MEGWKLCSTCFAILGILGMLLILTMYPTGALLC